MARSSSVVVLAVTMAWTLLPAAGVVWAQTAVGSEPGAAAPIAPTAPAATPQGVGREQENPAAEGGGADKTGTESGSKSGSESTAGPQDVSPKESAGETAGKAAVPELSPEQVAKDKLLRDRVQERWNAVIKRDFAKAYAFETPEYRKTNTAEQYAAQFGVMVKWHMATVKEVRYDRATEAEVVIILDYSFPLGSDETARTSGEYKERWVFVGDQWWRQRVERPLGAANPTESSPPE